MSWWKMLRNRTKTIQSIHWYFTKAWLTDFVQMTKINALVFWIFVHFFSHLNDALTLRVRALSGEKIAWRVHWLLSFALQQNHNSVIDLRSHDSFSLLFNLVLKCVLWLSSPNEFKCVLHYSRKQSVFPRKKHCFLKYQNGYKCSIDTA